MRGHWVGMVCAVGLMGCLVSGCSGQADGGGHPQGPGRTSPTAAASAVTSTTRTAASATSATPSPDIGLPPAARAHTEEGAKAFAAFYVEQIDVAARDSRTNVLRALADPSCGGCNSMVRLVAALKARAQHHSVRSFVVTGAFVTPYSTGGVLVIDVLVDDRGSTTVDASGIAVATSPAAKFTLRNSLVWRGSGWIITKSVLV